MTSEDIKHQLIIIITASWDLGPRQSLFGDNRALASTVQVAALTSVDRESRCTPAVVQGWAWPSGSDPPPPPSGSACAHTR